MNIDKEKLGKALKNKKFMKKIVTMFVMIAVAFYVVGILLGNVGVEVARSIMSLWGNIFFILAFCGVVWVMFVLDGNIFGSKKSEKKKKGFSLFSLFPEDDDYKKGTTANNKTSGSRCKRSVNGVCNKLLYNCDGFNNECQYRIG